jgi:carboxypeptidase-like protein
MVRIKIVIIKNKNEMLKKLTLSLIIAVAVINAYAQTQIIRGSVKDVDSQYPMIGVTVVILDTDPLLGGVTDVDGQYEIKNVPVGRVNLKISFIGYKDTYLNQQLLEIGKELIINAGLEEDIQAMDEIVITAKSEHIINNEAAVSSVRTFDVAETRRYAGSLNDIARMVSNYAGVSNADDSRNDIVIRGNSPVSLLWRLDGIDIPSPNHYNSFGSSGGPVSILNNNNLSNSDFITSSFPAAYGNTVSGVFDLQMKKGNGFNREYTGQIGFNGFELGAEGPFSSNSRASYMVNFRYSTLGVFKSLGMDFGTGTAVPEYQDLTFALDFPTKKAGSFKLFGIGGNSEIHFEPTDETDNQGNLYSTSDLKNTAKMGVIGLKHTYYLNPKTYINTSLATSYQYSAVIIDSLENNPVNQKIDDVRQNQSQTKYSINTKLVSKVNAKNKIEFGANLNYYDVSFQDSVREENGGWFKYTDATGGTLLSQLYTQYQIKFTDRFRAVAGVHFQHLEISNKSTLEPRLGLQYNASSNTNLTFGYGLHSQMQPLVVNFYQFRGFSPNTNSEIGFTKSQHFSAGIDQNLGNSIHLKVEGYYQHLFEVPIEAISSSYSILNSGASFGFEIEPNLVNSGFGKNYGLEVTLEKFFGKSYYFLVTGSLFESKYQGSDGVWRNTAFNNKYILNLLGGSEFKVSKSGVLTTDIKLTFSGGKYHTPIDLEQSIKEGETVYNNSQAFSLQYDPYFRTDFKIGFRLNMKRISQEWLINFQNITNRENIFEEYFNVATGTIDQRNQTGLLVIPQYRILF